MGHLVRYRLLLALSCSLLGANFFAGGCSIKKPQMPSWNTNWYLPLINRRLEMAEILDNFDDSNIYYDSAGNPNIRITQRIDTVLVDDYLRLPGADLKMKDSIGVLDIEPPSNVTAVTELDDILPSNLGYVPPAGFEFVQAMEPFDKYDWAIVEDGAMYLTFQNGLEVDLDTLIVTIIDSSDFHVIASVPFTDGLDYLETETREVDLSGQRISNLLYMLYHGHTPGGVLINIGGQALSAAVSFDSTIAISAARAEIPQITRTKSDSYQVEDSTEVHNAVILVGMLNLDVLNDTELPFNVTIQSPNFKVDGQDFSTTRQLTPRTSSRFTVDLAGFVFVPNLIQSQQFVQVVMVNTIPPSAPIRYTVVATDSLILDLAVSEITFQSLSGRIKPTPVIIDPVTRDMGLPDGVDESRLMQGSFYVNVENNSMIPAYLNLYIAGGGKVLNLDGIIEPKTSPLSPPMITIFMATPEQTLDFFDPPPEQIIITGTGILNPSYQVASLNRGDYFIGEIIFDSPFAIAMDDTVEIEPEISIIHVDESRPDNFSERIISGALEARIENRLPLGGMVTFFFGLKGDSALYTDSTTLIMGPYAINSAVVGPDGRAIEPAISTISDSLVSSRLSIFESDSVFASQRVSLFPTDSSGIMVAGSDYISTRANADIQIRFGE